MKLILTFILASCLGGCYTNPIRDIDGKTIDMRLVGKWKGTSETKEKQLYGWVMNRFKEGTYDITFYDVLYDGHFLEMKRESGEWWADGSHYWEFNSDWMMNPEKYNYDIPSENEVCMQLVSNTPRGSVNDDHAFCERQSD